MSVSDSQSSPSSVSRLLFLALATTANAAPQLLHPYTGLPYGHQHLVYQGHVHPYGYQLVTYGQPIITQHGLARDIRPFNIPGLQTYNGDLTTTNSVCGSSTDGVTGTGACTVTGTAVLSQDGGKDLRCGSNSGLSLDLQGLQPDNRYAVYLAADVELSAATKTKLFEFTAPMAGPGRLSFYVCTDGNNYSELSAEGKYLVVQDITSNRVTVGATEAVLA